MRRVGLQFVLTVLPIFAAIHEYTFHIDWFDAAPDGVSRSVLGINGMSPGPQITVDVGDTISVLVVNWLNVSTTIHWHGMLQRDTNEMDGVPHLTQRAIRPHGGSYLYSFVADMPGTYWYHSHYAVQYADGCRGALVIRNPAEPAYPEETLLLSDWYHTPAAMLLTSKYMTPASGGSEPVPDSALINSIGQTHDCLTGKGDKQCHYYHVTASLGSYACSTTQDMHLSSSHLPTRLRLINGAALAAFNFSVERHSLIIIAVDSTPVEPTSVTHVILNTGQRYDALLCRHRELTPDYEATNAFLMRAAFVSSVFDSPSQSSGAVGVLQYSNLAILTDDERRLSSGVSYISTSAFESTSFVPQDESLLPPPSSRREITLNIDFYPSEASGVTLGHFNHRSTLLPESSRGSTMLEAVQNNRSIPSTSSQDILTIYSDDHTQLVFNNHDDGNHPIHLHGHRFYVMGQGRDKEGDYDSSRHHLDYISPAVRDTVTVNPLSWTVIRLLDKNPGVWFMHCHIDWHVASGLAMVVVEYAERHKERCDENAL